MTYLHDRTVNDESKQKLREIVDNIFDISFLLIENNGKSNVREITEKLKKARYLIDLSIEEIDLIKEPGNMIFKPPVFKSDGEKDWLM